MKKRMENGKHGSRNENKRLTDYLEQCEQTVTTASTKLYHVRPFVSMCCKGLIINFCHSQLTKTNLQTTERANIEVGHFS